MDKIIEFKKLIPKWIAVENGKHAIIYADGTNVVRVSADN